MCKANPDPETTAPDHAQSLRRRAEALAAEWLEERRLPPPENLPELVHQLQVHQIELEMQNEALREARGELELSRDRYADLYDFAPVGYVTLDEEGIIRQINLTACDMLGHERGRLLGHPLVAFVHQGGKGRFIEHLRQCRRAPDGQELVAETTLVCRDRGEACVRLSVLPRYDPTTGRREYRAALADITSLKQAEAQLNALNETLEVRVAERTAALEMLRDVASRANRAWNTEESLEYCLRRVAEHNGWSFGHAFLPAEDDPEALVPACVWYAEDAERFRVFHELTLETTLRGDECLPGRVYARGQPDWTTDIPGELRARRVEPAQDLGIVMAAAFPVVVETRVVGVLEFFSGKSIEPDAAMLESMAGVGMQLGRVIERKAFQDRLLTLAEEEHRRIGQELHDDVGQELTGLALKAETLAEMLGEEETPASTLARDLVASIDRTRGKTRALARGLVPTEVDAPGLEAALEGLALRVEEGTRAACTFYCRGDGRVSDGRTATQLYRIAQEAVANALRHARATKVEITLESDEAATVLEIGDDGSGLPPQEERGPGKGLQIMRYRAALIGGKLTIGANPSGGTRVTCRLPKEQR
jgi:PAS domain S-box-containing protein